MTLTKSSAVLLFLAQFIFFTYDNTVSASEEKPFAEAHLILQLSDADPQSQSAVLSIANNLIKHYGGPEFIDIEIVTFGPGLKLLYADNPNAERISSLLANDVRFIACQNTINTIARKSGKSPDIIKTAITVPAGVAHIITRSTEGYVVVRP